MKTKPGIIFGITVLLLAAMFTLTACGDADGGPTGGKTYTYNTPASQTVNGITATVSFNPASPSSSSEYSLYVAATVSFTGTAIADGVIFVFLTSDKVHNNSSPYGETLLVTTGQTSFTAQTFELIMDDQNVDDLVLTFSYTAPVNISITSNADWTSALETIKNGGNSKHYILTVSSDIGISGSAVISNSSHHPVYSFGEGWGLYVTVEGSNKLSLTSDGCLFFVKSGQTLIIDGPTLVGKNSNTAPLVYVNDGALRLISGAITNNINTKNTSTSENHGGGVYFTGSASYIDGVVYTYSSFTMTGGTISGNTAISGGGVYVGGGTFTKSGGVIYGNSSVSDDNVANNNTSDPVNAYGHAVYYRVYNWDVEHIDEYYRDTTLDTGDNISTSQLPASGTGYNWTKK